MGESVGGRADEQVSPAARGWEAQGRVARLPVELQAGEDGPGLWSSLLGQGKAR